MAKMYYNLEEAMAKLGCSEEQFRSLVRSGKLREFRDAGKLNYRVEEVDKLAAPAAPPAGDSSGTGLELGEIPLGPGDSDNIAAVLSGSGSTPGLTGSAAAVDLGSSGSTGGLSGSTDIKLEDSTGTGAGGSGSTTELRLEDTGGASGAGGSAAGASRGGTSLGGSDAMALEEVDKDAVQSLKKDDTVITNIGISVFDEEDLEIKADPMAKTLMTGSGAEEHLGLDGSGGGSGLLDLTRESDDTSLGAELLEGIDMADTAEAVAAKPEAHEEAAAPEPVLPEPTLEPGPAIVQVLPTAYVEPVGPLFTGLLISATIALALVGAMNVATAMDVMPEYLRTLEANFWFFLGGTLLLGGLCALVGWVIGRPRVPRPPRVVKPKEEKKPKKQKGEVLVGAKG